MKRDQDMAEVKNCLGHQNDDIVLLSVQEQLIFINAWVDITNDTTLSEEECNILPHLCFL